jgi:hypothetical protein
MVKALQDPNWRFWPIHFDVPTTPQLFGQIVVDAGIEGIAYTSVLTKKPCLVIYPQNFANSSSYVQLDDPTPVDIVEKRIDATTFKSFV